MKRPPTPSQFQCFSAGWEEGESEDPGWGLPNGEARRGNCEVGTQVWIREGVGSCSMQQRGPWLTLVWPADVRYPLVSPPDVLGPWPLGSWTALVYYVMRGLEVGAQGKCWKWKLGRSKKYLEAIKL